MNFNSENGRSDRLKCSVRQALCATLLWSVCASTMAAELPRLQPITDPSEVEHHVGKVVFVELVTPDLDGAKRFYGSLFGWTFREVRFNASRYAEVSLDGRLVAGMFFKPILPGEQRQPAWLGFIAATDVNAIGKTAMSQGAKTLSEPHDVPGRGRVAVYADPQGAVFGVIASSNGDPSDALALPGEWIWHSLFAEDLDKDAAFYQALFDYEVFDLPGESDDQHVILATDGYARAGANALLPKRGHAHWLNYVRVLDAGQTTARVIELGGKVLLAARDDRHGGKIAIVADPQGAPFGLLEWPDDRLTKVAPLASVHRRVLRGSC